MSSMPSGVRPAGNDPTGASWTDRVVLSRDAIFDASDTVLASAVLHSGVLGAGGSYPGHVRVALPRDAVGDYFILVKASADGGAVETDATNNVTASATLHVARAVCRRAERRMVALEPAVDGVLLRYINRLSDLLFVVARVANHRAGAAEREW